MSMRLDTAGEQLLQRQLRTELRGSIPHYEVGQHEAEIVGEDTHLYAVLTFVNVLGHAVLLLCRKGCDSPWEPWGVYGEAGQQYLTRGQPPDDWEFSETMLAVLDKAECEWEKKFPSGG